jgi:hypothetical protein
MSDFKWTLPKLIKLQKSMGLLKTRCCTPEEFEEVFVDIPEDLRESLKEYWEAQERLNVIMGNYGFPDIKNNL